MKAPLTVVETLLTGCLSAQAVSTSCGNEMVDVATNLNYGYNVLNQSKRLSYGYVYILQVQEPRVTEL